MFSRRASRQGSESGNEGPDWGSVQEVVRSVQNRPTLSKDILSSVKKGLKSAAQSTAGNSLTQLDAIAINCGQNIRSQLADPVWMEMLLSACYKYPATAVAICQLLSNWICSFSHEQLGHAAQYAAQALKQKGFYIPVPTALAYHLAETSQQGGPTSAFQQGTDFNAITRLSPTGNRADSQTSRQSSGPTGRPSQLGGSMNEKVEAMQTGAQQLREVDQLCQSIIDAGPAAGNVDASQHSQKGWQLARQCNGWANEVQVMVACEPQDHILAILLETNDQLLAAISSWDATAHRLTLLESQQPAAAAAAAAPSTSNSQSAATQQSRDQPSSSNQRSAGLAAPASVSAGGSFWDSSSPRGNTTNPAQRQSGSVLLHPQSGNGHRSSDQGLSGLQDPAQASSSSSSYLDELGGLPVSQYPHQQLQSEADAWQAFGGGPTQLPPISSSSHSQGAQDPVARAAHNQSPHEYHGSVLNYTLKEQQPESITYPQIADPFSGPAQSQHALAASSPESPFTTASATGNPFDSLPPRPSSMSAQQSSSSQQQHARTDNIQMLAAERSSNSKSSSGQLQASDPFSSFTSRPASGSGLQQMVQSNDGAASAAAEPPFRGSHISHSISRQSLASTASAGSTGAPPQREASPGISQEPSWPSAAENGTSADPSGVSHSAEIAALSQQLEKLQAQQAQHEEEVEHLKQEHTAQVAAIQTQAVNKMKELIDKVKLQTLAERQQGDLRLEEAHQAEENAVAQMQLLRRECREKDATIAALQARLNKPAPTPSPTPSFDLESYQETGQRTMSSAALDSATPQSNPFGGIPRPRSASSQLPALGGPVPRRPVQRAGSHLDRPSASSSMQAYYRQPALRVRFVPGQLEELTRPVSGASHKQWAAQLKLPPMHQ